MREAIILALAGLAHRRGLDEGFLNNDIQFEIEQMAGRGGPHEGERWDDRSATGKAYYRAREALKDDGVIVVHPKDPNSIEYILAVHLPDDSA
jgi:hypothetical protein